MALEGLSQRFCVPPASVNYDLKDEKGDEEGVKLLSNKKSKLFGSTRDLIAPSKQQRNSIIKKPNQKTICGNRRKRRNIAESESEEELEDKKETQTSGMDNQKRSKRRCVSSIRYWEENFTLEDFQYDEEDIYSLINASKSGCDLIPKAQCSDSATTKANTSLKGAKRKRDRCVSRSLSSDPETTKVKRISMGAKRKHHGSAEHSSSNLGSSSSSSHSSSSDSLSIHLDNKALQRPAAKNVKVSSLNLSFRDLIM